MYQKGTRDGKIYCPVCSEKNRASKGEKHEKGEK